ncbi:SWIM zinc finger family protein [Nocardiopsis aegyptia]
MAGATSYHRGVDYVSRVDGVTLDGDTVRGTVSGTYTYRVELTPGRRELEWDCDCPWAEEGNFCKHCVALGLVYLFDTERGVEVPPAPDLRTYLTTLGADELVGLVLEAADSLPGLRLRLEVRAGISEEGSAPASARALVDEALRIDDFVEYGRAREYAQAVHGVADELEALLGEGSGVEAEALARHAIGVLDEHAGLVDDSAGHVGGAAARIMDVHVRACAVAEPDPAELAGWLLRLQREGSGMPEPLLESYADVLGEEGMERYREELFEGGPGDAGSGWTEHFLRSEFARVVKDTDLLVRVYSSAENVHYAGIVQVLDAAGRAEEALEWAGRGLRESGGRQDDRLVEYAVRAHREAGREEEVQALRWEAFERSPEARTYRALREETPAPGWPAVRAQALAVLRRAAARRRSPGFPCTLVEVLVDEANAEEAWEAAAEHGCDDRQWLRVAALRETSHPEDAIGVYIPRLEAKVRLSNTSLYPEAAELARRVRELYERLGRMDEAESFTKGLRTEHRRKRRFLAELDRVGLGG